MMPSLSPFVFREQAHTAVWIATTWARRWTVASAWQTPRAVTSRGLFRYLGEEMLTETKIYSAARSKEMLMCLPLLANPIFDFVIQVKLEWP